MMMLGDIKPLGRAKCHTVVKTGDSRRLDRYVPAGAADLVVTSPPYLNNYDYADRTRMETYFMGWYGDWADISHNVRDKLMMASVTQITKNSMKDREGMPTVLGLSPKIHGKISKLAEKMDTVKAHKPGKKNYGLMTRGYFEDISKVIIQVETAVRKGGHFVLVLGDSAPYGVHVPTDRIVADMAKQAGFKGCVIRVLRRRGDKWKGNPQRHGVRLRESLVSLAK